MFTFREVLMSHTANYEAFKLGRHALNVLQPIITAPVSMDCFTPEYAQALTKCANNFKQLLEAVNLPRLNKSTMAYLRFTSSAGHTYYITHCDPQQKTFFGVRKFYSKTDKCQVTAQELKTLDLSLSFIPGKLEQWI